jgi:hypothetical protein
MAPPGSCAPAGCPPAGCPNPAPEPGPDPCPCMLECDRWCPPSAGSAIITRPTRPITITVRNTGRHSLPRLRHVAPTSGRRVLPAPLLVSMCRSGKLSRRAGPPYDCRGGSRFRRGRVFPANLRERRARPADRQTRAGGSGTPRPDRRLRFLGSRAGQGSEDPGAGLASRPGGRGSGTGSWPVLASDICWDSRPGIPSATTWSFTLRKVPMAVGTPASPVERGPGGSRPPRWCVSSPW